jgi:hypothetical protein
MPVPSITGAPLAVPITLTLLATTTSASGSYLCVCCGLSGGTNQRGHRRLLGPQKDDV